MHVHSNHHTNPRVDTNQPPVHIEKRATGIASNQCSVGLDRSVRHAHQSPNSGYSAAFFIEPPGMTQGKHPISKLRIIGLVDRDKRERFSLGKLLGDSQ